MVSESRLTTPLPSRPPFTAVPTPSSPPATRTITWEDAQQSNKLLKQDWRWQGCFILRFGTPQRWDVQLIDGNELSRKVIFAFEAESHSVAPWQLNECFGISNIFSWLSVQLKPIASSLEQNKERLAKVQLHTRRFAVLLNQLYFTIKVI